MAISPFSEDALKGSFRVGDSGRWKVDLEKDLDAITASAAARAAATPVALKIVTKVGTNGVNIYSSGDIETDLILRAAYKRLIKQYQIRLPNREEIITGILEALAEGSPFLVTRCDVESFYENIRVQEIVDGIVADTRTVPQLRNILNCLSDSGILQETGAPRGLAISNVLAELCLKDFDMHMRKYPGVHRYFRFADDLVIISLPSTQVLGEIEEQLELKGLSLNEKTVAVNVKSQKAEKDGTCSKENFSFLGYNFSVSNGVRTFESRPFSVSISEAKLKKRQTRMVKSFQAFLLDKDGGLLLDRLNYLTSNQSVYRTRHTRGAQREKIRTGIYYNYPHCGAYPASKKGRLKQAHSAAELVKLDGHLKTLLFGSGSTYSKEIAKLPAAVQKNLRRLSFNQGYRSRLNKRFSRVRMRQMYRIWGHD